MSNPKFIQNFYLKIWGWNDDIKNKIGEVGDKLQYIIPISFLVYCLIAYGYSFETILYVIYFLLCVGTSTLLKILFNNLRPREWDDVSSNPEKSPDMNLDWSPTEGQSFSSGHTAASFAGALPWFVINPIIGIIMVILASFVGFSRMVVKAHWLRDVLASITFCVVYFIVIVCIFNIPL